MTEIMEQGDKIIRQNRGLHQREGHSVLWDCPRQDVVHESNTLYIVLYMPANRTMR